MESDTRLQEQVLHILRHIADGVDGVELLFAEMGDSEMLLDSLAKCMESENEDVVLQVILMSSITVQYLTKDTLGGVRTGKCGKQCLSSDEHSLTSQNPRKTTRLPRGC